MQGERGVLPPPTGRSKSPVPTASDGDRPPAPRLQECPRRCHGLRHNRAVSVAGLFEIPLGGILPTPRRIFTTPKPPTPFHSGVPVHRHPANMPPPSAAPATKNHPCQRPPLAPQSRRDLRAANGTLPVPSRVPVPNRNLFPPPPPFPAGHGRRRTSARRALGV